MKKTFLFFVLISLIIGCTQKPNQSKSANRTHHGLPFFKPYSPKEPEIKLPKITLSPGKSTTITKPTAIILDIKPECLIGILAISDSDFEIQTITFPSTAYKIPWQNNKKAYLNFFFVPEKVFKKNQEKRFIIKAIPKNSPLKIILSEDRNLISADNKKVVFTKEIPSTVKFAMVVAPNHLIKFYSENGKVLDSNEIFLGIFPTKQREYKFECTPIKNSKKKINKIGFLTFTY